MRRTLLSAVFVLAACASSSTQGPGANHAAASGSGSDAEMVCKEETPTGSSIPRKVCRSQAQSEDDRRGAQDMLVTPHPTPTGH